MFVSFSRAALGAIKLGVLPTETGQKEDGYPGLLLNRHASKRKPGNIVKEQVY